MLTLAARFTLGAGGYSPMTQRLYQTRNLGQPADFAEGLARLFHITVAPKGGRLGHAICGRRLESRHRSQRGQSRSGRTPGGKILGGQSRSVRSLGGKSRRGTRNSSIRQIRRKPRRAIPIPMDNPIPTGYPSPIPTGGYPRPNSAVSTHCPTEGERVLRGSADRSCPAPSVAAADAADRDKLGRFASLSAADNTSS